MPNSNRGGAAAGPPPPPPPPPPVAGPSLSTSVYDTALGLAALTWSRAVLGLSLRVDLRLAGDDGALRFRVRPWLFWKRRGSKRFHLKGHRTVDVAWDLARARFPSSAAPEPSSGYYVSVSVGGDVLLIAGDLVDEACRRLKALPLPPHRRPVLVSRREHVVLGDAAARRSYRTSALVHGRERQISIELGARGGDKDRDAGMSVAVDGERVLSVRRLRWKFRGSESVPLVAGGRIQISWDLHSWLFQSKDAPPSAARDGRAAAPDAAASPELGHAMLVLRFEGEERKEGEGKGFSEERNQGHFGGNNKWNLSERNGSLRKTSSWSSSNSSGSSWSVMDWASTEEVQLHNPHGFSLLLYAWNTK